MNSSLSATDLVVFARSEGIGVGIIELANSIMINVPSHCVCGLGVNQLTHRHENGLPTNGMVVRSTSEGPAIVDVSWVQLQNSSLDTLTGLLISMPYASIALCANSLLQTGAL